MVLYTHIVRRWYRYDDHYKGMVDSAAARCSSRAIQVQLTYTDLPSPPTHPDRLKVFTLMPS